jgi:hypothetical protein
MHLGLMVVVKLTALVYLMLRKQILRIFIVITLSKNSIYNHPTTLIVDFFKRTRKVFNRIHDLLVDLNSMWTTGCLS